MKRDPSVLSDTVFDVAVVGGGIAGAAIARDAALRGLSAALIDSGDWCQATSAHSLKIAHGGIRYLQHADFRRVRESCRERSAFLRTAPHLVHPLEFVIPAYGHGRAGKEILAVAFQVLAAATFDRNRGIADPDRTIPAGRTVSRDECLRWHPAVEAAGLTGAGVFHDAQLYNPPRLVLAIVRSAVDAGARAVNYCEAKGWLKEGNRVTGVRARDLIAEQDIDIRARVVVNAAGPYAEELLVRSGQQADRTVPLSRDMAVITPRPLVRDRAMAVQTRYRDPDAVFTRGNRHLFVVPWREYTLIGVHSKVYEGQPSQLRVTEEEVQTFLDEIAEANPRLAMKLSDVTQILWGLLPFGLNEPGQTNLSFGKRSVLTDHAATQGVDGLITAMSVRFTTGRSVAERAVNLVFKKLGRPAPPCRTETTPVHGGAIDHFAGLVTEVTRSLETKVPAGIPEHLAHNHGTAWKEIATLLEADPTLGKTLGSTKTLEAEVVHAARQEMAITLADVILRRTDAGTGAYPGDEALRSAANRMATELGWTPTRIEEEITKTRATFPEWARSAPSMSKV